MTSRGAPEIEISVVLPCFNEAESLEPLTGELYDVLRALGRSFEIIFVNDASIDSSPEVLRQLERRYPELRAVHHVVNCGESAAQATGFQRARGEIVITMDSDGQNDPGDLPRLLDAIDDVDAVCGVRRRREDTWVKRISSRVANGFRNAITGDRVRDAGCTYRALRRAALREIPVFNGMHRFLPTLLRLQGYRVVEIAVNDRPRTRGVSKYGVGNRLVRGILDCFAMRWWRRRVVPGGRVKIETEAFLVSASEEDHAGRECR
jgi:glycosyltransferase involved in cell wall biosynthesis